MSEENNLNKSSENEDRPFILEYWDLILIIFICVTALGLYELHLINNDQIYTTLVLLMITLIMFIAKHVNDTRTYNKYSKNILKQINNRFSINSSRIESVDNRLNEVKEVYLQTILDGFTNLNVAVEGFTQAEVIIGTPRFYQKLINIYSSKDVKTVDVTYFTPDIPDLAQKEISQYWEETPTLISNNPNMVFRRIATVESKEKLEWILKDMNKFKNIDRFNLNIINKDVGNLLLNVIVIDEEQVFIFGPHLHEVDRVQKYVYVKNSEIGSAMEAYFSLIWHNGINIKQGKKIFRTHITEIRKKFN